MQKLDDLVNKETERQQNEICLIASENLASPEVKKYMSTNLTNKYAEGYCGKRFYGGCEVVDEVENLAIDLARKLFGCNFANVQPHSGSQANQAVYLAFLNPGDTVLSLGLNSGGHLTHGAKVSSSGKLYNFIHYDLDEYGTINYGQIETLLYKHNPKLLVLGASAYSREIDFELVRKMLDKYNEGKPHTEHQEQVDIGRRTIYEYDKTIEPCLLMVDMAHIAGLVAAGYHTSPVKYADVVTSTTHKTLRGPRGGFILWNNDAYTKKINSAVFPGIQGGPLMHVIAAKAQCFYEALTPSFKEYIWNVLKNRQVLEKVFLTNNIPMVSGGSDNHLILLDLTDLNISGKLLEDCLGKIGIVVNKNMIPNDKRKPNETSGIRIGTPNVTSRGFTEVDMIDVGQIICKVIRELQQYGGISDELFEESQKTVQELCKKHPII